MLDRQASAALRLAESFLLDPGLLDPGRLEGDVLDELEATFSGQEIAELALNLMGYLAFSKLRIALGLEPEQMDVRVVD